MTTFNTNTHLNADLNARGRQMAKARDAAEALVLRLVSGLPALFARRPVGPAAILAKAERREAARRAVDNLLR
ncbi:hypothetical protein [Octadecabacter antarcticus]|uniref:hypothetical protein n=1 Tax=Octadecabacter antarcticus TaxID=1217908 RepID=UPI0001807291|nr:hypothetical protein [Octadecabacter antarcticus]